MQDQEEQEEMEQQQDQTVDAEVAMLLMEELLSQQAEQVEQLVQTEDMAAEEVRTHGIVEAEAVEDTLVGAAADIHLGIHAAAAEVHITEALM